MSYGQSDKKNLKKAIGLMSGTSADGVDAALIETDGHQVFSTGPYEFVEYDKSERSRILEMMQRVIEAEDRSSRIEIGAELSPLITERHCFAVEQLMKKAGLSAGDVDVVGFHGQTLYHAPCFKAPVSQVSVSQVSVSQVPVSKVTVSKVAVSQVAISQVPVSQAALPGETIQSAEGFTLQVGDGAALAQSLSIPVVYDFRSLDVKAGGQGAPLVPIYHQALARAAQLDLPVVVVNIGGVANVSYIDAERRENDLSGGLVAFDTGPGNVLLDEWIGEKTGARMDKDGAIAASGQVAEDVLEQLLKDDYFDFPVPKSLDRYHFSRDLIAPLSTADGAATLVEFTVRSIAQSVRFMEQAPLSWVIVGGGGRNAFMMQRLRDVIDVPVLNASELGWEGGYIEAEAFGFLAVRHLLDLPMTFPMTTGVSVPLCGGRLATPG